MTKRENGLHRLYQQSLLRPVLVPLVLLIIAVLLRIVDIFLLPLAEATGEAILHKALGLVLVVTYVWGVGQSLAAIGLHGRQVGKALFIGVSGPLIVVTLAVTLQWVVLRGSGERATLVLAAVDYTTGLSRAGLGFALWLILGNLVNSSMEEGLFRGIMLSHFRRRLSPWQANFLQAAVFGLWHLAWPIRHWTAGRIGLAAAVSQAVPWVLGSAISGLAYGYMFLKTDSLWTPWIAHTVNNTLLNLIHIRTSEGLDANTTILNAVIALGYLALLLWTKVWAKQLQMPALRPWGASADDEARGKRASI